MLFCSFVSCNRLYTLLCLFNFTCCMRKHSVHEDISIIYIRWSVGGLKMLIKNECEMSLFFLKSVALLVADIMYVQIKMLVVCYRRAPSSPSLFSPS